MSCWLSLGTSCLWIAKDTQTVFEESEEKIIIKERGLVPNNEKGSENFPFEGV